LECFLLISSETACDIAVEELVCWLAAKPSELFHVLAEFTVVDLELAISILFDQLSVPVFTSFVNLLCSYPAPISHAVVFDRLASAPTLPLATPRGTSIPAFTPTEAVVEFESLPSILNL